MTNYSLLIDTLSLADVQALDFKALRIRAGLTTKEIAEGYISPLGNFDKYTYSKIENKHVLPTMDFLEYFMSRCNMLVSDFATYHSKSIRVSDESAPQVNIVDYLGIEYENAVPRKTVAERSGLSDRVSRKLIEAARLHYPIVSGSYGEGYYLTVKKKDLKRQLKREAARVKSIRRSLGGLYKQLLEG